MALWKVTPTIKKSCIERQYFANGNKEIVCETGWRWGTFYLLTEDDKEPIINEGDDIFCCDYELKDYDMTDGCWEEYSYKNMSEDEVSKIEEFMEENSIYGLEEYEDGWIQTDGEMIINCEVEIELVDSSEDSNEDDEDSEEDSNEDEDKTKKSSWPF